MKRILILALLGYGLLCSAVSADVGDDWSRLERERAIAVDAYHFEGGQQRGEEHPVIALAPRYFSFEERERGSSLAARALLTVLASDVGDGALEQRALERLNAHYRDQANLGAQLLILEWSGTNARVVAFLSQVSQFSRSPENRAYSLFVLGLQALHAKDVERATAAFRRAQVECPGLPAGHGLSIEEAGRVKLQLYDGLNVGTPAPDILGLDLRGENMRLSDFRGKVVLLYFWGDW